MEDRCRKTVDIGKIITLNGEGKKNFGTWPKRSAWPVRSGRPRSFVVRDVGGSVSCASSLKTNVDLLYTPDYYWDVGWPNVKSSDMTAPTRPKRQ